MDDILTVPDEILPHGFRMISTNRESEWGSRNAFFTTYKNEHFTLGLTIWFIHYPSDDSAISAYRRYERGTFWYGLDTGNLWINRSGEFLLDNVNYDDYDLRCMNTLEQGIKDFRCATRMRYGQCVISIGSNLTKSKLTKFDFVTILNYINTNMVNIKICYPS